MAARTGIAGQPTVPQIVGSVGMAFVVISTLPPFEQREAFALFVGQMLSVAAQAQAQFTPRPVV